MVYVRLIYQIINFLAQYFVLIDTSEFDFYNYNTILLQNGNNIEKKFKNLNMKYEKEKQIRKLSLNMWF